MCNRMQPEAAGIVQPCVLFLEGLVPFLEPWDTGARALGLCALIRLLVLIGTPGLEGTHGKFRACSVQPPRVRIQDSHTHSERHYVFLPLLPPPRSSMRHEAEGPRSQDKGPGKVKRLL